MEIKHKQLEAELNKSNKSSNGNCFCFKNFFFNNSFLNEFKIKFRKDAYVKNSKFK